MSQREVAEIIGLKPAEARFWQDLVDLMPPGESLPKERIPFITSSGRVWWITETDEPDDEEEDDGE